MKASGKWCTATGWSERKPNPEAFEQVTQQCGLDPESVLFIDDTRDNITGAARRVECRVPQPETTHSKNCSGGWIIPSDSRGQFGQCHMPLPVPRSPLFRRWFLSCR